MALITGAVAGLFLGALAVGPVTIPLSRIAAIALGGGSEVERLIIIDLRLPRALLALLIGGNLGLAGAALQALLRNSLAAPDLFAAPQMASFGAVLVLISGGAGALSYYQPVAAALGALMSVLIRSGFGLSAASAAATALVMSLSANPFAILEVTFWLLGSLEDRSWRHVAMALPFIAAGSLLLLAGAPRLRTLGLGEEAARSLGVDVSLLRTTIIAGTALGVGGGVAVAGTIGYVGLVAAHLVRPIFGYDPGRLLVPSALAGAGLLLAADIVARLIPTQTDIKVGIITALIGVPFLIAAIIRERRVLGAGEGL